LGMVTKYAEGFLAVRFRRTDEAGEKSGGPQFYLEHGIKGPLGKVLGLMFAIFAVLACFGIGNMTQGNSIAANVESSWSIPAWITGAVLTVLTLVVLIGGIKSIGRVTAGLVPIMIVFYVLGAIYILIAQMGAGRGLLSNESGLGSAPIAAAAAQTTHPVRQGLVSMTQTFIDTIIVVSFTGLTIIATGTWDEVDPATGEQISAALMT